MEQDQLSCAVRPGYPLCWCSGQAAQGWLCPQTVVGPSSFVVWRRKAPQCLLLGLRPVPQALAACLGSGMPSAEEGTWHSCLHSQLCVTMSESRGLPSPACPLLSAPTAARDCAHPALGSAGGSVPCLKPALVTVTAQGCTPGAESGLL